MVVVHTVVVPKHDFTGRDLREADLRGADLTEQVLYDTDLRHAHLAGAKISIDCATLHGVILDDENVGLLLSMIARAKIDDAWKTGIEALVRRKLGDAKWRAIRKLLDLT